MIWNGKNRTHTYSKLHKLSENGWWIILSIYKYKYSRSLYKCFRSSGEQALGAQTAKSTYRINQMIQMGILTFKAHSLWRWYKWQKTYLKRYKGNFHIRFQATKLGFKTAVGRGQPGKWAVNPETLVIGTQPFSVPFQYPWSYLTASVQHCTRKQTNSIMIEPFSYIKFTQTFHPLTFDGPEFISCKSSNRTIPMFTTSFRDIVIICVEPRGLV